MSERLTVVFDDAELYRRLKVSAAEQGVPVKHLIQEAVRRYLGQDLSQLDAKPLDWATFDEWMREADALAEEVRDEYRHVPPGTTVRLPGDPLPAERMAVMAEERVEYDPQ